MQNEEEISLVDYALSWTAALVEILVYPIISFGIGFVIGILAKFFIGNLIVQTCLLFNFSISIKDIPSLCGLLSFIGSFFRD